MSIVALENEYITLECDPEAGIVRHTMHRFVISAAFREAMERGLDLMREHGATKWLSDDRQNGPLSNDDLDWGLHEWRPRAIAAGLAYWAIVLPEAVLGNQRARRIVEAERRRGLAVEVFAEPGAARRWLDAQPGPPRG